MAPGKSIFMNVFMIWMMGSGSGIFSILMVGYAVMNSFSSLVRVNAGTRLTYSAFLVVFRSVHDFPGQGKRAASEGPVCVHQFGSLVVPVQPRCEHGVVSHK